MQRQTLRLTLTAVAITVLARPVDCQPKRGDLVIALFALHSHIAWIDMNGGKSVLRFAQQKTNHSYRAVAMDVNNRDLVAALWDGSTPDEFHRVSPLGLVTTLAILPNAGFERPTDIRLDQDGAYVVSNTSLLGSSGRDLVTIRNGILTTVLTNVGGAAAMAIDPDTGDYLVTTRAPNGIAVVDRQTLAVTTMIAFGNFLPNDIAVDERTGLITVANGVFPEIVTFDRSGRRVGSIRSLVPSLAFNERGNLLLSQTAHIAEVTIAGVPVRTYGNTTIGMGLSLMEYGTREVAGIGVARPGQRYDLVLNFLDAGPAKSYAAALSLGGRRPGIALADGRTIGIVPDALFMQTAIHGDLPGITRGLRGTTGLNGTGTAAITIPQSAPVGLRVYATAVIFDPAAPLGLRTANTWAFTID